MTVIVKETVKKDIRDFILETYLFGDESETYEDDSSFLELGIIDSTGVLELTSYIEEKYNFSIDDDEMIPANLDTVNNLVAFIERKTQ